MSSIKNVLVCSNKSKKEVVEAEDGIIEELRKLGFSPIKCVESASRFCDGLNIRVLKDDESLKKADFMLIIGGDGTMLRFANDAAVANIPMLGINMGKLGFMTELEPSELPFMRNILEGNYTIDRRMMLDIYVKRGDKLVFRDSALNDAVITKGNIVR
ncbi:MAG: NAD(+)/NADH kinase, partial [Bacillota bacterium]|nr:NAD(+)/NADH kinase [Bacillota bacterium]